VVKDKIRSFGDVSADQPPPTAETRNRGSRPKAERRESQVGKKTRQNGGQLRREEGQMMEASLKERRRPSETVPWNGEKWIVQMKMVQSRAKRNSRES